MTAAAGDHPPRAFAGRNPFSTPMRAGGEVSTSCDVTGVVTSSSAFRTKSGARRVAIYRFGPGRGYSRLPARLGATLRDYLHAERVRSGMPHPESETP